ncbi:MAG: tellurite resistance TerB family protein [Spirochaetes bacterium]|jgi:uncharacterized tellurite resistance protein B-like protein|nr:tellurite resistance TerB family protein [Spirochaetota bacterium]
MINTQAILDILFMAITIDNEIHSSEITTIKEIIYKSPYTFPADVNEQIDSLHTLDVNTLSTRFNAAITKLSNEPEVDKRTILRLVMRIVDADNIMHETEVRLLSRIIKEWKIDV